MNDWGSHGLPLARIDDLLAIAAAFFVLHGRLDHPSHAPMRTRPHDKSAAGSERTGELTVTAFPVALRPGQDHPFVSVGRIPGNDIAFADETVSKFHAFVRHAPDGLWLQDARSKNGTFVDGVVVPARGSGPPAKLETGVAVRFGSVIATFLDGDGLRALAATFGLRPASATAAGVR